MSDQFGIHAGRYRNDYSESENRDFAQRFSEITQAMATCMVEGVPATDDRVQQLIQAHYEFCLQFWTPTREAYKSLATSYILPSPYHDSYESVAPGLGKYHYDAIVTWADAHLS